ncbi:hypothetical protein [Shimia sp. FJ5]|uniref:hypothetical protein n=1 Tax=Shimia sp. FJ5 TaxID=3079054 RepID=UPI0026164AC8|nr:hypothetical protein [Shimia sp. FJ5]MDV4144484.1 hypothetical protein [Shimia sp. FJ5]
MKKGSTSKLGGETPLDLEKIRKLFPPDTFRVSYRVLSSGDVDWMNGSGPFGSMAPCRCFVLRGAIAYQFGDQKVEICAGECKLLDGGEYSFSLHEQEVELVQVWELPKENGNW